MEASLTNILELALQQGIWAALYIYLFLRMLSENKAREDKYQTIIDRLSGNIEQGKQSNCRPWFKQGRQLSLFIFPPDTESSTD